MDINPLSEPLFSGLVYLLLLVHFATSQPVACKEFLIHPGKHRQCMLP